MTTFMEDLKDVLKKHNAELNSCGCCGGIWVEVDGEEEDSYHSIRPDTEPEPKNPPHAHIWGPNIARQPDLIEERRCTVDGCNSVTRMLK